MFSLSIFNIECCCAKTKIRVSHFMLYAHYILFMQSDAMDPYFRFFVKKYPLNKILCCKILHAFNFKVAISASRKRS